jgi:hypothetical protein
MVAVLSGYALGSLGEVGRSADIPPGGNLILVLHMDFSAKDSRTFLVEDMFACKGLGSNDVALEKVCGLGPKLINPPHHMATLASDWNPSQVKIEKINLSKSEGSEKFCIVLHNVLSKDECQHLINLSEHRGYEPAQVNVGGGKEAFLPSTRNSDRCIYDDPQVMEQVWQRILRATSEKDKKVHHDLAHIPWVNERCRQRKQAKSFQAVGLNERMRFLRYGPGNFFAPHLDGSYVRSTEAGVERYGEQSFVTFQLYLNEDFKGGATRFISEYDAYSESCAEDTEDGLFTFQRPQNALHHSGGPLGHSVIPRTGSVLLFQHDCCHEGARVLAGRKYAIRSDVMYTTQGPGSEYAVRPIMARHFDDLY